MDAVNPVDELNALKRIQQTLKVNRNDIGALLELAALQEKADLKRKLLNRVLTLEPVNKQAREMLLEMDRAELHGERSQTTAPLTVSAPSVNEQFEKPFISQYSILHQILVYPFVAFSIAFMFKTFGDWEAFLFFTACFLLLLIPLWFVSAVVKVDSSGIMMSRLYGIYHRMMEWSEIETIKPAMMGMKLSTRDGRALTISSQMHHYSVIVEILCKIRPDQFNTTSFTAASHSDPASFTELRTFQRNSFIKYGVFFLATIGCMVAFVTLFIQPLVGLVSVIFIALLWVVELNTPYLVQVQGNRITTKSMLRQEEWTAAQIKDISIRYLYTRRGLHKRHHIHVETVQGKAFKLAGFTGGDEILYGFLKNWWNTYQNT